MGEPVTYEEARGFCDALSERLGDWQGIPVPLPDLALRLCKDHPMADLYRELDGEAVEVIFGGPDNPDEEDETVVNCWFSRQRNATVYVYRRGAKAFAVTVPRSPDQAMDRLKFWVRTIGASDAWDIDAEHRARATLRAMLTDRQWRHYDLTGSFLETSPRSGLLYVFRRLRPTVALSPRWPDGRAINSMRAVAVLCLHPLGYYEQSWGGCMVPSDDVIAHLSFCRGDEARFWGAANQHEAWTPEAGL